MLAFVARAVPIVFAVGTQGVNSFARFAVPTVFAVRSRRICPLTSRAVPIVIRTGFVYRVVFCTAGTIPEMFAVFVRR